MRVRAFGGALIVSAISAVILADAVAEEIPEKSMRWGHFAPAAWGSAQADQVFADEIRARTDGRVEIRIFWSGAIGGFGELQELTASSAIDIGSFVPTYYPADWPMMGPINSLPLTWEDPILAMEIQAYLIENNEAVKSELEQNNVVPIVLHGLPPYRLQCNSPIRNIADLRGKRIRTFGEWPPFMFEQLGAVPVNIPLGEVYEALQRGSIDCGYNPNENAGFLSLYEVAPYWSDVNLGAIAAYTTFMSRENWEAMSDSLKDIFREARQVAEAFEKDNFAKLEQKHLENAKANGMQYIAFEEQEKLNAMFPDMLGLWKERLCSQGMCAEAESVVADMRRIMERRQ